jgi:uncharacterized iron-regulated protein
VGLEVFDTSMQAALGDTTATDDPDEEALLARAEWSFRKLPPYGLYRPFVDAAREKHFPLLGLGVPPALLRKVATDGFPSLTAKEQKQLPDLVLDDPEHRALFDATHRERPKTGTRDTQYAAAVLLDDTMAGAAAAWLGARQPARQLVIVTSAEHCRAPAVPGRLHRLTPCQVVTVRPVLEHTGADLQQVLTQYDYAVVLGSDND